MASEIFWRFSEVEGGMLKDLAVYTHRTRGAAMATDQKPYPTAPSMPTASWTESTAPVTASAAVFRAPAVAFTAVERPSAVASAAVLTAEPTASAAVSRPDAASDATLPSCA